MADPVSVATSIVGLLSVGAKTSLQLSQFIESIRAAPGDIRDLAKELADVCSILEKLQTAFSNTNSQGSIQHKELSRDFQNVLDSCMDKFIQLQMLVKSREIKNGDGAWVRKWKGWRWTFQEKEVMALKTQLEAHKATLNITLALATYTDLASLKNSQTRLEDAAREIIERLIDSGDGESTAATYQASSSFVLQRYLSSPSIFSSPPSSPVLRASLDVVAEEELSENNPLELLPKAIHRSSQSKNASSKTWTENVTPETGTNFPARRNALLSFDPGDLTDTMNTTVHSQGGRVVLPKVLRAAPVTYTSEVQPSGLLWGVRYGSPPGEELPPPIAGGWSAARETVPVPEQVQLRVDQLPSVKPPPKDILPIMQLPVAGGLLPTVKPLQVLGQEPYQPPPIAGQPFPGLQPQVTSNASIVLNEFARSVVEIPPQQSGANASQLPPLSSILRSYEFRCTQPSMALQDIRNTIKLVNQDFNFSQEANRLYEESATRRQAQRGQERSKRNDKYWQRMYKLQAGGQITQDELQERYSQFEWDEKRKEELEARGECDIYNAVVYQRIHDKLQQSIGLLTENYSRIVDEIPRVLAGEDRWLLTGGIELTELLGVWLELWNQIEARYDMTETASLKKKEVFEAWEIAYGETSNSESDLKRAAKEQASKWASGKRERTNGLTVAIDGVIAEGLSKERSYLDKVSAAANNLITGITNNSIVTLISMRSEIVSTCEILKEVQLPYIQITHTLQEVELLGNVWKCKSMLVDLKPTSSSISKVKELKNSKDREVRKKYEQEIAILKKKFWEIDMSLKKVLDKCGSESEMLSWPEDDLDAETNMSLNKALDKCGSEPEILSWPEDT